MYFLISEVCSADSIVTESFAGALMAMFNVINNDEKNN